MLAFALGALGAMAAAPLARRIEHVERWVVVGDTETVERLKAYEPLRDHARIVHIGSAAGPNSAPPADRDRPCGWSTQPADRVVIASRSLDDKGLLASIKTFRSLGVPVSLLPRPLDLLEAPAATPEPGRRRAADRGRGARRPRRHPYAGPDRRARPARTKVSVVVPAMNEGENIGHVLERFPRACTR